jgi:hypothetical protein
VNHAPIAAPAGRSAPRRVLEDESGHRFRRLRFVGRLVALLALAWLSLIVLGGLGVGPAKHVPFGSAFHIAAAPPRLRELPKPRPASAPDLAPALAVTALVPSAAHSTPSPAATSPPPVTKMHVDAAPGATVPKTKASRPTTPKGRPASVRPAAASPGRSTAPHRKAATAKAKAPPAAAPHVKAAPDRTARATTQVPAKPGKIVHGRSTSTGTTPHSATPATTTPASSRPSAGTGKAHGSPNDPGRKKP